MRTGSWRVVRITTAWTGRSRSNGQSVRAPKTKPALITMMQNGIVTTTSDRDNNADSGLVSKVVYDGFGRTKETRLYEGGTNYILTEQQYDALGRSSQTSNPYRPYLSESAVWTTTAYDTLSRIYIARFTQ